MFSKKGFRPVYEVRNAFFDLYGTDKEASERTNYRASSYVLKERAEQSSRELGRGRFYSHPTPEEIYENMNSREVDRKVIGFLWYYILEFLKKRQAFLVGPLGEAIPVIPAIYDGGDDFWYHSDPSSQTWHYLEKTYLMVSTREVMKAAKDAETIVESWPAKSGITMEYRSAKRDVRRGDVARALAPYEGFLLSIDEADFPDHDLIRKSMFLDVESDGANIPAPPRLSSSDVVADIIRMVDAGLPVVRDEIRRGLAGHMQEEHFRATWKEASAARPIISRRGPKKGKRNS